MGRFHIDVLGFQIEHNDGPAARGRLLDEDLDGVGFAGAHGAEDADVARQRALVTATQAHDDVVVAGQRADDQVAATGEQVADLLVGQIVDGEAGAATRLVSDTRPSLISPCNSTSPRT